MKIPFGSYAVASGLICSFLCASASFIMTFTTNLLGYTDNPLLGEYIFWYAIAGFFSGIITVYIILKDVSGRGVLRRKPRF